MLHGGPRRGHANEQARLALPADIAIDEPVERAPGDVRDVRHVRAVVEAPELVVQLLAALVVERLKLPVAVARVCVVDVPDVHLAGVVRHELVLHVHHLLEAGAQHAMKYVGDHGTVMLVELAPLEAWPDVEDSDAAPIELFVKRELLCLSIEGRPPAEVILALPLPGMVRARHDNFA